MQHGQDSNGCSSCDSCWCYHQTQTQQTHGKANWMYNFHNRVMRETCPPSSLLIRFHKRPVPLICRLRSPLHTMALFLLLAFRYTMKMNEPVFKIASHNLRAIILYYSKSRKILQLTYPLRVILFTQMGSCIQNRKNLNMRPDSENHRMKPRAFLKSVFVPKPAHTHWLPLQS